MEGRSLPQAGNQELLTILFPDELNHQQSIRSNYIVGLQFYSHVDRNGWPRQY